MRAIHTFVLRLLLDSNEPQKLRGALQSVPEGKPRPFADGQSLLILLNQMAQTALEQTGKNETQNEDDD
jgi:hypothetical protein